MFFTLIKNAPGDVMSREYIGIVVAHSIEDAAAKIGLEVKSIGKPPQLRTACAILEKDHRLEEIQEITGPIAATDPLYKVGVGKIRVALWVPVLEISKGEL
jgi:hypothetical protein